MRLSWAGTRPCRHTTRSLLSLVWNTTSWSFPGETLTPVTWEGAREAEGERRRLIEYQQIGSGKESGGAGATGLQVRGPVSGPTEGPARTFH